MTKNLQRVGDGFGSDSCEEEGIGMDRTRQLIGKGFSSDSCKGRMFVRALKAMLTAVTILMVIGSQVVFAEHRSVVTSEWSANLTRDQAWEWARLWAGQAKVANVECAVYELSSNLAVVSPHAAVFQLFQDQLTNPDTCAIAKRLSRVANYLEHYVGRGDSSIYHAYRVIRGDVHNFKVDWCMWQIWAGGDVNTYFYMRRVPGVGCAGE